MGNATCKGADGLHSVSSLNLSLQLLFFLLRPLGLGNLSLKLVIYAGQFPGTCLKISHMFLNFRTKLRML